MKPSYIKINLYDQDYEVWYSYFKGSRATLEEPAEPPTWEIEKIIRLTTPDSDLAKEDLEWYEAQSDFEDKVIDKIIETIESEKE
jgi:hypothetical protein